MVSRDRISSRLSSPRIRLSLVSASLILLCLAIPLAAQGRHAKKQDFKHQVEALEEQWRKAQLAGDVATMDHMLADDFIGISMTGQVNTKQQQLDRVKTRKLVITRIDLSDMKVRLEGSVAIVTSQAEVEGTNEDQSMKGLYRYMRIYHRDLNGDWKITHFEATRIHAGHNDKSAGHGMVAPSPQGTQSATVEPRFG